MKTFLLFSLTLLLVSFSDGKSVKSNLYIPAGEQFNLGGGQNHDYRISAKNAGAVDVDLFLNNENLLTPLGKLKTNETFDAVVPSGRSLIIRNPAQVKAHIKVHVKGKSSDLAMYYNEVSGNK